MHKTFTDCYLAKGFTGGGWNYATNSNNADGADIKFDSFKTLPEKETRLAYYVIGWDSVEVVTTPSSYFVTLTSGRTTMNMQEHGCSTLRSIS